MGRAMARFDARTHAAQESAIAHGRRSAASCSQCGSVAPLYRRPRPGFERTFPLADHQMEAPICGLCLDGVK